MNKIVKPVIFYRMDHVFNLQGFSAEELHHRYIELEVYGKSNQRKDLIGTIILAGSKSKSLIFVANKFKVKVFIQLK